MSKFKKLFEERISSDHRDKVLRKLEDEMVQLHGMQNSDEEKRDGDLPIRKHISFTDRLVGLISWRPLIRLAPILAAGATAALVWVLMPTTDSTMDTGEEISIVGLDDYEMLEYLDVLESEDLDIIEILDEIEGEVQDG